jgi:hypothetical protein
VKCDIIPRLWRLLGRSSQDDVLLDSLREKAGLQRLIGKSRIFRDVVDNFVWKEAVGASAVHAGIGIESPR